MFTETHNDELQYMKPSPKKPTITETWSPTSALVAFVLNGRFCDKRYVIHCPERLDHLEGRRPPRVRDIRKSRHDQVIAVT